MKHHTRGAWNSPVLGPPKLVNRVQNLGPKPESIYGYQLGVLLMTLGTKGGSLFNMVAELQRHGL